MLPVIIFEPNQNNRNHLRACLKDYCRDHASSMSLLTDTASVEEAVRYLNDESGIMLLMLSVVTGQEEARRGAVQLGRKAMRKNRDNYTLYCLHNANDMESLLNTGVRPVGVLVHPFDSGKLEKLLTRIDRDYAEMREQESGNCLVVDSGNTTYRLPFSRVLYIEALDKKLNICTERQSLSVRMTLNNLEDTLPGDVFFRCHRSYLVNIRAVDHVDFTGMELTLTSGDVLPLSRTYRDKLKDILEQERTGTHGA